MPSGDRIVTTYKILDNVQLGDGSVVEDFCIIGTPPRGHQAGDLATTIGEGSTIRSHTVIYAGNVIGSNFQTGNKVNIRESNQIGNNVSIGTLSVVEAGPRWNVIHSAEFGEECYASPALVDGRIYLRTSGHLYCFGDEKARGL